MGLFFSMVYPDCWAAAEPCTRVTTPSPFLELCSKLRTKHSATAVPQQKAPLEKKVIAMKQ